MAAHDLNWNPSKRQTRLIACAILPGMLAIAGGVLALRSDSLQSAAPLWIVSAAISLTCLALPQIGWLLYLLFNCVTYPITWALSRLVPAILFYLVLTPFGVLLRLIGRDALKLKRDSDARSFWTPREQPDSMERYFKQF
ncbi:MAG TPA: hypothetical protein PL033_01320 [Candidatus Brocadiia bacterium]|nr:hypothetical protein [Candidatus Brocadiia bacterium]